MVNKFSPESMTFWLMPISWFRDIPDMPYGTVGIEIYEYFAIKYGRIFDVGAISLCISFILWMILVMTMRI